MSDFFCRTDSLDEFVREFVDIFLIEIISELRSAPSVFAVSGVHPARRQELGRHDCDCFRFWVICVFIVAASDYYKVTTSEADNIFRPPVLYSLVYDRAFVLGYNPELPELLI